MLVKQFDLSNCRQQGNESTLNWDTVGFGVVVLHTLIVVSYPSKTRLVKQTQVSFLHNYKAIEPSCSI